jgi:hypothetical protein
MATIQSVMDEVLLLSRVMWRGPIPTPNPGMQLEGMLPAVHREVRNLAGIARATSTAVHESQALLTAVNEQTLGRIETQINAINEQTLGRIETAINDGRVLLAAVNEETLGRIESEIKDVLQFLPTVRGDMNDLSAKLDTVLAELNQDMTDLHAKLDGIKADIQTLPH